MKTALPAVPSPWSVRQKLRMFLWELVWTFFCSWTPKPANPWRLLWLRVFGASIHGTPFVHQRARIQIPWNLTLHDRACLGDGAHAYSLGRIEIGAAATVAQDCYLCTGTHDFEDRTLPLRTAPIFIGEYTFLGARTFVMPGVTIGRNVVVGACSIVTKNLPDDCYAMGSPCAVRRPKSPI